MADISRLATVAFEYTPDVVFRNGRVVSAIQAAINGGEGERLIPLLTVWAKKLAQRIVTHLPDECELSLPDAMINVGPQSWRWPLIESILHVQNTGARLRTIATLTSRWNDLSSDEQRAVIHLISQDGSDADWLRAAALTRRVVSSDIVVALTGWTDLNDLTPPELLAELGEPLYCACIHTFIGAPQPLWWLGSHHTKAPAWVEAVQWSAGGPTRPCFQQALDDRIFLVGDDDWLVDLVNQYKVDELPAVFAVFLNRKISDNGNWQTPAWNCLLDRGMKAGLIDDWFVQISDAAPAFLDHLRDVRLWLGNGPHRDRLLAYLDTDVNAYRLVDAISRSVERCGQSDNEVIEGLTKDRFISKSLEILQYIIDQDPPRLLGTWDYIAEELNKHNTLASPIFEWVQNQRSQVLENHMGTHRLAIDMEDQSELVGWVGPR